MTTSTDVRLLAAINAATADIIGRVSTQLPGAQSHGRAPDWIFERIRGEAETIIALCDERLATDSETTK